MKNPASKSVRFQKRDGLPEKVCATCDRPFTYRKKWRACWDEVRYCSERCRTHRKSTPDAKS